MQASIKAFLVCLNHAHTSQQVLDEATIIKFLKSFNLIMFPINNRDVSTSLQQKNKTKRNKRYFMRKL